MHRPGLVQQHDAGDALRRKQLCEEHGQVAEARAEVQNSHGRCH